MTTMSWMQKTWFRILAIMLAVIVAGYTLLVPTSLLYMSIGSTECLGPECGAATATTVIAGAAGLLVGITTCVLLILLAAKARNWLLIACLVGLMALPVALLTQAWGLRALSDGRALYGEAQQISFDLDRAMQEVLVEVTGASSLQQPGINGPDIAVVDCEQAEGPGYQGSSSLTFTSGSNLDASTYEEIEARFTQSRERMIMLPASIELQQQWQPDGADMRWTVTTSCQPLPSAPLADGTLPSSAVIEYRFTDSSIPPEYHRSYTLRVTKDETSISIDSYGDLLYQAEVPTPEQAWQDLTESYPSISSLISPPEGSCTGDTSSAVLVTAEDRVLLDLSSSSCDDAAVVADQIDQWIKPARSLFAPIAELAPASD